MSKAEPLLYGQYYHVYNRGNNGETLFCEERNYPYFLKLYAQHIEPVAEAYAYCLMPNHFHFLVRIKDKDEDRQSWSITVDQIFDGKTCSAYDLDRGFFACSHLHSEHGRLGADAATGDNTQAHGGA